MDWGKEMLKWIVKYRTRHTDQNPVQSSVKPNFLISAMPEEAPLSPEESFEPIMNDLTEKVLPGLTGWESSKHFFAYFKPHSSYPAVIAELLCAGVNQMGFDWVASPACTEMEIVTLDWLAKFLNLPDKFLMSNKKSPGGGVIQGSAGESATVVLLAAIAKTKKRLALKNLERGKCVVYCTDQTHAIVEKSTMILGTKLRKIKTFSENHYALRCDSDKNTQLEDAIRADIRDGLVPVAVVATCGTTNTCAFDSLPEIAVVAQKYNLWLHVDGAYGGAYACLPELRKTVFRGLESVNSFGVNAHKKLLIPFDLAALYVDDRRPLLDALSLQPEYLRNDFSDSGAVVDYEHWQMPLGRRFRALKLWFVFRRFGRQGLFDHVQRGVTLSKHVEKLIKDTNGEFELVVPRSLSLVCFRWNGGDQKVLLDAVKSTGKCFIIHTKLDGKMVLRFACGGIEQTLDDVTKAFNVIVEVAKRLKD